VPGEVERSGWNQSEQPRSQPHEGRDANRLGLHVNQPAAAGLGSSNADPQQAIEEGELLGASGAGDAVLAGDLGEQGPRRWRNRVRRRFCLGRGGEPARAGQPHFDRLHGRAHGGAADQLGCARAQANSREATRPGVGDEAGEDRLDGALADRRALEQDEVEKPPRGAIATPGGGRRGGQDLVLETSRRALATPSKFRSSRWRARARPRHQSFGTVGGMTRGRRARERMPTFANAEPSLLRRAGRDSAATRRAIASAASIRRRARAKP